jgi:hypothetical protein
VAAIRDRQRRAAEHGLERTGREAARLRPKKLAEPAVGPSRSRRCCASCRRAFSRPTRGCGVATWTNTQRRSAHRR